MKNNNLFKNLVILDIANNHFGDFNHCKKIIDQYSIILKKKNVKCAFKFQFRELDTFIHKTEKEEKNNLYTNRFLSTKIEFDQFKKLTDYIKKKNHLTACTPFDETSVDYIEKYHFDYLKIASASSREWSLLERVCRNKIPKIISTGGLDIDDIDKIVSFFMHKNQKFSIMHCVAVYPSSNEILNLSIISELKKRYPNIEIGWSTHEDPWNFEPVKIAYSLGARIFEKHIGINSKKYKLNNYSLTPEAFEEWYNVIIQTKQIIGDKEYFKNREQEVETLNNLGRGVYLKNDIKKNQYLTKDLIYLAFPNLNGQLSVSKYKKELKVKKNLFSNQPIMLKDIIAKKIDNKTILKHHLHKVRAILNYSKVSLGNSLDLEISHHYGPEKISNYGCVLINCINRKYCKKILVLTERQRHPLHYHKRKEETFHIIFGTLYSKLNGKLNILKPGDKLLVKPRIKHEFWAGKEGCVFEEVSTTSYTDDSFYLDKIIKNKTRDQRKTTIKYKLVYQN
jgi:N-acetylneuraminate synthase